MLSFAKEARDLASAEFVIGTDEAGRGPLAGPVVSGSFCFVDRSIDEEWVTLVNDSKQISEANREEIYDLLRRSVRGQVIEEDLEIEALNDTDRSNATDESTDAETVPEDPAKQGDSTKDPSDVGFIYAYGVVEVEEIDIINILEATMKAMTIATEKLIRHLEHTRSAKRVKVLIDGNRIPRGLSDRENTEVQCIVKGDATVFSIAAASIVAKCVRDRIMRKLDSEYPEYGFADHKGYATPAHKNLVRSIGPSRIHRLSFEPCFSLLSRGDCKVPDGRRFEEIVWAKEEQKENRKKKKQPPRDPAQTSLKRIFAGSPMNTKRQRR